MTDGYGNAVHFILTDGGIHDSKQAENLLKPVIHKNAFVLGDKGYDSDKIIEFIESKSAIAVIPPKSNRKIQREYDKKLYKNRNQVERFFNRIKQFRRIATRYDKLAESFLALVQLAAALVAISKFSTIV